MPENIHSIMERLIQGAGIGQGMRVLDVGCGNGDVSNLLASAVGVNGEVVGVDLNEAVLNKARSRFKAEAISQVSFVVADITRPLPELGTFDAIIGRRVLMYLPDPVSALTNMAGMLKQNGVVAFQEHDSTVAPGRTASLPLHDQVNQWLWQTIEREGGNIRMGFALPAALGESGFVVENLRAEAIIQGQALNHPLADIVRAVLPRIVAHGVASEADIAIETLAQRLTAERSASTVYISDLAFSVWARKPS